MTKKCRLFNRRKCHSKIFLLASLFDQDFEKDSFNVSRLHLSTEPNAEMKYRRFVRRLTEVPDDSP